MTRLTAVNTVKEIARTDKFFSEKVLHPHSNKSLFLQNPGIANLIFVLQVYWKNGKTVLPLPTLEEVRQRVHTCLATLRNDHKRNLNPTPYKVLYFNYDYLLNRSRSYVFKCSVVL